MSQDFNPAAAGVFSTGTFAKSWRIASKTFSDLEHKARAAGQDPMALWAPWTAVPGFPRADNTTSADRYLFLNDYLTKLLAPQKHPQRPDMNGVGGTKRAWLLGKVLSRLLDTKRGSNFTDKLIFPEDLSKVADDIYLLHKHHGKLDAGARTLQHYTTAEDLRHAMKPWRPKHPMSWEKRDEANKQFLRGYKGNQLVGLPRADGNGEAQLIATLRDGTELIRVQSKEASRAYGSRQWCTARESFSLYKNDLLIMLDPDGQRWQLHFGSQEFKDADDAKIPDLKRFLYEHEGLSTALEPFLLREYVSIYQDMKSAIDWEDQEGHRDRLDQLRSFGEQIGLMNGAVASVKTVQSLFFDNVEWSDPRQLDGSLNVIRSEPHWRDALAQTEVLADGLNKCLTHAEIFRSKERIATPPTIRNFQVILHHACQIEEWSKALAKPKGICAIFKTAAETNQLEATWDILRHAAGVTYTRSVGGPNNQWIQSLAQPDGIPAAFSAACANKNWKICDHILNFAVDIKDWHGAVPKQLIPDVLIAAHRRGPLFKHILDLVSRVDEWRSAIESLYNTPSDVSEYLREIRAIRGRNRPQPI